MTAALFSTHFQAVDVNGNPLNGAKLYFYIATTTTPLTVYQDAAAGTPHAIPVVADTTGLFAPIYIPGTADFKIVLQTSAGVVVQTVDNIPVAITADNTQPLNATLTTISTTGMTAFTGYKYLLNLSNDTLDAVNDMDIAAGVAVDATTSDFMNLSAPIVKRLDATWTVGTNQGGRDTGSIANTTYYVWLIKRPDTGVVDVLYSASATAPTMPTNYTLKRRIGSIVRSGGSIAGIGVLAASSLNLDNMDLIEGDVVGTTTTTAITLKQGDYRILRPTGAWPATASASLIVHGSTTISHTWAASDLVLAVGGAGAIVYLWTVGNNILQNEYTITATKFAPRLDNTVTLGGTLTQFAGLDLSASASIQWDAGGSGVLLSQSGNSLLLQNGSGQGGLVVKGNLDLSQSGAGLAGQIVFPAVQIASANANTLDDYSEGTFTPTMTFNASTTGVTYSTQAGYYIKIGQLVLAFGRVTLTSNGSGVGTARVASLPYTSLTTNGLPPGSMRVYAGGSSATGVMPTVDSAATTAQLSIPGATSATAATDTNVTDTFSADFCVAYRAAA